MDEKQKIQAALGAERRLSDKLTTLGKAKGGHLAQASRFRRQAIFGDDAARRELRTCWDEIAKLEIVEKDIAAELITARQNTRELMHL